jgi:hypothetical protein
MSTAASTLDRSQKTAKDLLYDARNTACICGGRAPASWNQILELNGHGVAEYKKSLLKLLKDLLMHNHTLLYFVVLAPLCPSHSGYELPRATLAVGCKEGGGKGLNHFYIGAPNSGKTALTRPLLALLGKDCFVKPQVGVLQAFMLLHVDTVLVLWCWV